MESILSSKGQFASSKLSINRDTWATRIRSDDIDITKSAFTYDEGIKEVCNASN